MPYLTEIVLIFLLSIGVNIICSRFKLPTTIGFLLTGVLCGPNLLGVVNDTNILHDIADLGVAMLMFTIGMELSGDALNRLKRPVFLGGSLQIGLIVLATWAAMFWLGYPLQGIFWGCLIALSSSAIVLKIFQQKGISGTPVCRLSLAILVFQDIMVAPMMLLVPLLAGTIQLTILSALEAALKITLLGTGIILFTRYGLDRLMSLIVRTRSSEVLLLTTLCLCLGFATLTNALGMSFSLGAFLAGLMLARSQYSMSVIADILPYRDVFLSLFFISVGMMLDINFVLENLLAIISLVVIYIVLKTLLSMPAVLIQGYPLRTAIRTSLSLAQVGEFSFVLAASGFSIGMLSNYEYQFFLALSVITMMLAPAMIEIAPSFSAFLCHQLRRIGLRFKDDKEQVNHFAEEESPLENHIIIVGFGFSGQAIARTAKECHLSYNVLEMNPETVKRFSGIEDITYGDASQSIILEHMGISKARVIAIVISDPAAVRAIVANARAANEDITIIARTRFVTEIAPLYQLGATHVVAEEFESSISVFSNVLATYMIPVQDIDTMANHMRLQNYRTFQSMIHATSEDFNAILAMMPEVGVRAIRLESTSPLCNIALKDSCLRSRWEVTVVAVYRNETLYPSPAADFVLLSNDILYLFAKKERLYEISNLINHTPQSNTEQPTTV